MQPSENAPKTTRELPTAENRLTKLENKMAMLEADISALRRINRGEAE